MDNILTGVSFGIVREGIVYILFFAFSTLVFSLLGMRIFAIFFLILTGLVLNFFRDPERFVPEEKGAIISPADGKIVEITKSIDPITGEKKNKISIFMNIFNVHVNRAPVSGKIQKIRYIKGKFFNASFDKASSENERNILLIHSPHGDFTVVQIAGLIARRIVCWVKEGDDILKGQRIGMIKFGSRVDLYLPKGYEIIVQKGEKVLAGESIVAKRS